MQVASRTHTGLVRENNEDALLIREPYLFAVADGMGGYAAGEIASRSTLKAFEAATHRLRHDAEEHDAEEHIAETLLDAFAKANEHVLKMSVSNASYEGMGTTLTALYLSGGMAYCCHLGDSRLYLYRGGCLSQMTHDHTFVANLLQQGEITGQEARIHPQRHMLLQAVGVDEYIRPQVQTFQIHQGDRLLLCSDGLSDMVEDSVIAELLREPDSEKAADSLLEQALANGGRDNVTLLMIDIDGADCISGAREEN